MGTLSTINYIIAILFTICYSYQFLFIPIVWVFQKKKTNDLSKDKQHRYAILICARNEEIVIADLIQSIKQQTYPSHLIRIFVLADNCTDGTAEIAKKHGATDQIFSILETKNSLV